MAAALPGSTSSIARTPFAHLESICRAAWAFGERDVLVSLSRRMAAGEPGSRGRTRSSGPGSTADDAPAAVAALLRFALSAVADADPALPVARVAAVGYPLLDDLWSAMPMVAAVHRVRGCRGVTALAVPAMSEPWQDLWKMARLVSGVELAAVETARLDPAVSAYRRAAVSGDFLGRCSEDTTWVWAALLALLGARLGDDELCRVTCAALLPLQDQMVVLGHYLPVGPVGWFVAEPLFRLGRSAEAREANGLAETVSWRLGARAWIARCRAQRRRWETPEGRSGVAADTGGRSRPAREWEEAPARTPGAGGALTERQRQILEMAAQGLTNAEIARSLYVSVATVERHCTMVYRALGVRNRAQALAVLGNPEARPGPN